MYYVASVEKAKCKVAAQHSYSSWCSAEPEQASSMNRSTARISSSTGPLHGRSEKKPCPCPRNTTASAGFPISFTLRTYTYFHVTFTCPAACRPRPRPPASARPARTGGQRRRRRGATAARSGPTCRGSETSTIFPSLLFKKLKGTPPAIVRLVWNFGCMCMC